MESHVNSLCRSCFFQLRRLRMVRHSLTTGALNTLVHAFISSRLDYCNSALYGCSGYLLRRLQSARLIYTSLRIPKYAHISAQIREKLHWLPISARINFKICLIVRGCLVGHGPVYLQELCKPISSAAGRRSLRSADRGDLIVPLVNGKPFKKERTGRRAFAYVGPTLWNKLSLDVRREIYNPDNFKRKLKTFFFDHQQL